MCAACALLERGTCTAYARQVLTLLVYFGCIVALGAPQMIGLQSTFDIRFMLSAGFAWRVAAITAASTAPIWLGKLFARYCAPQVVRKLPYY